MDAVRLRALCDGIGSLYEVPQRNGASLELPRGASGIALRATQLLESLIPCDWASVSQATVPLVPGDHAHFWSAKRDAQWRVSASLRSHFDQHPVWAAWRTRLSPEPLELCVLTTAEELDRLAIMREVFRPLSIANMMGVCCPQLTPIAVGVARDRRREFSRLEHEILLIVANHAARAMRRLNTVRREGPILAGVGHMLVGASGEVLVSSPGAGGLVTSRIGQSGCASTPGWMQAWLEGESLEPLERYWADGSLMRATCVHQDVRGRLVAIEIIRPGGSVLPRWATDRLRPREQEVARWVVAGKTNPEIGTILGISPRTVQKHLERMFAEFGVPTRTALAAELLDPPAGPLHE